MLSDFLSTGLGAGVVDAGGVGAGVIAGGLVMAGFGGSLAFSGLFPQAATRAAAISTSR